MFFFFLNQGVEMRNFTSIQNTVIVFKMLEWNFLGRNILLDWQCVKALNLHNYLWSSFYIYKALCWAI